MKRVALGSIFRNSTSYLGRYFNQARGFQKLLNDRGMELTLFLVEGDSVDDTWNQLAVGALGHFEADLIKRAHGGPWWGSVDVPERWKALSWCCNGVMERVTDEHALIYVESDLWWEPETMMALVDRLDEGYNAVSPMCFTSAGHFYDVWGYLKDGVQFSPFPPYHEALSGLTPIDSAGSCIAMSGKVARVARFGPLDCVRGLGRSIRENGFTLWVDPSLKVVHL